MIEGAPSRRELVEIFWSSHAPQSLSEWVAATRVLWMHLPAMKVNLTFRPEEEQFIYPDRPHRETLFYLEGRPFSPTEMWVSVMADGMTIVPPFPLSRRGELPKMQPADIDKELERLC